MKFQQPTRRRGSRYVWAGAAVLLLLIVLTRQPCLCNEKPNFRSNRLSGEEQVVVEEKISGEDVHRFSIEEASSVQKEEEDLLRHRGFSERDMTSNVNVNKQVPVEQEEHEDESDVEKETGNSDVKTEEEKEAQLLIEAQNGFSMCAFVTTNHRPGAFYLNDVVASVIDQPNIRIIVYNGDLGDGHTHFFEKFSYWNRTIVKQRKESVQYDPTQPLYPGTSLKTDVHMTGEYNMAKNDAPARKMWRTKECLDFVQAAHYAMRYCGGDKTEWYLFLEDDTVWPSRKDILQVLNPSAGIWQYFLAEFTGAVLFRRVMLESFLGYAQPRCDLIPIDWLMDAHTKSLGIGTVWKRVFRDIGKVSTKDFA